MDVSLPLSIPTRATLPSLRQVSFAFPSLLSAESVKLMERTADTAAILLWLEKYYDKDHKYSWPSTDTNADKYRSEVLQWIFFVHGGVGPMQGQLNHFRMQAVGDSKNVVPYAYTRYLVSIHPWRLSKFGSFMPCLSPRSSSTERDKEAL